MSVLSRSLRYLQKPAYLPRIIIVAVTDIACGFQMVLCIAVTSDWKGMHSSCKKVEHKLELVAARKYAELCKENVNEEHCDRRE